MNIFENMKQYVEYKNGATRKEKIKEGKTRVGYKRTCQWIPNLDKFFLLINSLLLELFELLHNAICVFAISKITYVYFSKLISLTLSKLPWIFEPLYNVCFAFIIYDKLLYKICYMFFLWKNINILIY